MGQQLQPDAYTTTEVRPPEDLCRAVQARRMTTRSDYSFREQAWTFLLAAAAASDAHLHDEMQAAADIVGSRTYFDLVQYDDLIGSGDCNGVVRWLDQLWNANVSGGVEAREGYLSGAGPLLRRATTA
jgi:hypothetical protein